MKILSNRVKIEYFAEKHFYILLLYIQENAPHLMPKILHAAKEFDNYLEKMERILDLQAENAETRDCLLFLLTERLGFRQMEARAILCCGSYRSVLEARCAFDRTTQVLDIVNPAEFGSSEWDICQSFAEFSFPELMTLLPEKDCDAMFCGSDPTALETFNEMDVRPSSPHEVSMKKLPQMFPNVFRRTHTSKEDWLAILTRILKKEISCDQADEVCHTFRKCLLYTLRIYFWGKDQWRNDALNRTSLSEDEQLIYDLVARDFLSMLPTWELPEREDTSIIEPLLSAVVAAAESHPDPVSDDEKVEDKLRKVRIKKQQIFHLRADIISFWSRAYAIPFTAEESMALLWGNYRTVMPRKIKARYQELGLDNVRDMRFRIEQTYETPIAERLPLLNEKVVMHCRFRCFPVPEFLISPDMSLSAKTRAQQTINFVLSNLHPGEDLLHHIFTKNLRLTTAWADSFCVKDAFEQIIDRFCSYEILEGFWGRRYD